MSRVKEIITLVEKYGQAREDQGFFGSLAGDTEAVETLSLVTLEVGRLVSELSSLEDKAEDLDYRIRELQNQLSEDT